jgi:transmembrane protease serine 9
MSRNTRTGFGERSARGTSAASICAASAAVPFVPAKAGTQRKFWFPAFAGMSGGWPAPNAKDSSRAGRPLRAALAAAAAIACAFGASPLHANEAFNIGPRSLYGLRAADLDADMPLVMRDAIHSLVTGARLFAVAPRIIGGTVAPAGAYPWMASIQVRRVSGGPGHFCGGSFVAANWVLTAAHCVDKDSAGRIRVVGGTESLDQGGSTHFVDRIVVHENWDSIEHKNDVALLRLTERFKGRPVRVVSPAEAESVAAPGRLATVAGWGLTAEGGQVSNNLRHVTVQIVSNKECNGLASYSGAIADNMLCAGFAEGGKDSCQGDSGGPLVVPDRQGGHIQIGVVSFGEGCARPNKFGVYARVSTFQPWIAAHIGSAAGPLASAPFGPQRDETRVEPRGRATGSDWTPSRVPQRPQDRIPEAVQTAEPAAQEPVPTASQERVPAAMQRAAPAAPRAIPSAPQHRKAPPPRRYVPYGWGWVAVPR